MLKRQNGATLWQQVSERLSTQIVDGVYPPGARLPAEMELADMFGVSRNTLRRAMAKLEEQGLIRIGQGQGTFVSGAVLPYTISRTTRYSENLSKEGRAAATEVLKIEATTAEPLIADMLAIDAGDHVLAVRSRSWADEAVLTVATMHYPSARFPGLAERRRGFKSQTAVLKAYGITDYRRLRTWITTRPPTDEEARMLQTPRSQWVLHTRKVDVDADGVPLCCSESCWASDKVEFVIESD